MGIYRLTSRTWKMLPEKNMLIRKKYILPAKIYYKILPGAPKTS